MIDEAEKLVDRRKQMPVADSNKAADHCYIVMAYIVMAYIVMAYIVVACIVITAWLCQHLIDEADVRGPDGDKAADRWRQHYSVPTPLSTNTT